MDEAKVKQETLENVVGQLLGSVDELEKRVYVPNPEVAVKEQPTPLPRARVAILISLIKEATKRIKEVSYNLPL